MPCYRFAPIHGDAAYWLCAKSEEEARRLIALNVGELLDAEDPAKFSCTIDDSKQPPPYLIIRKASYPASIERR